MSTFLVLVFLVALVAFVVNRKAAQPLKLVGNIKKVEAEVVKVVEVATKQPEIEVTEEVVKKPRKPRTKKITSKKKKES